MNRFPTRIEYINGLIKDAVIALKAKRGRFYPTKDFGSRIDASQNEEQILAYARQGVSALDGVYVKSVEKLDNGLLLFNLSVNDHERTVEIDID